jgi:hypothetical protein
MTIASSGDEHYHAESECFKVTGWGAKGTLDTDRIRSLASEKCRAAALAILRIANDKLRTVRNCDGGRSAPKKLADRVTQNYLSGNGVSQDLCK